MGKLAGSNVTIERGTDGLPERLYYGSVAMSPQDRLRQRYRTARQVWRDNTDVQSAAALIGMTEREYCDRYIELFGPLFWTGTSANVPAPVDHARAYREAKP
jgi:hypothetical protein